MKLCHFQNSEMFRFIVLLVLVTLAYGNAPVKKYLSKSHIERIVGGTETTIEEHPFQVSLILTDANGSYLCGGSILNARYILTAAHCMKGINSIDVRAGSNKLFSGGTVVKTVSYRVHPQYNAATFDYDMAIVDLLRNALPLNSQTIKPVVLASSGSTLASGTPVVVAGYGAIRENGPTSETLLETTVNIVDRATCAKSYRTVTTRMICAGVPEGGKDSCQGDSGGPLILTNKTQVGVVSFGTGCARPGIPGVYTNVAALRSWIKTNTGV